MITIAEILVLTCGATMCTPLYRENKRVKVGVNTIAAASALFAAVFYGDTLLFNILGG